MIDTVRTLRDKVRKRGVLETARRVAVFLLTPEKDLDALIEARKLEDAEILAKYSTPPSSLAKLSGIIEPSEGIE